MSAMVPFIRDALREYTEDTDTGRRHTVTVTTGSYDTMRVALTDDQWVTVCKAMALGVSVPFPTGVAK